jgi:hypothetical protein
MLPSRVIRVLPRMGREPKVSCADCHKKNDRQSTRTGAAFLICPRHPGCDAAVIVRWGA